MKLHFLLPGLSCLLLLFSSCEKHQDPYPEPTTAELLIGSWQESTSTLSLYDAGSKKITENAQPLRTATFDKAGKFSYRYVDEKIIEGNYTLSMDSKGEYITFAATTNESLVFKIIQISEKELTVTCEMQDFTYYVDDKPLIAATAIRRMRLSRM